MLKTLHKRSLIFALVCCFTLISTAPASADSTAPVPPQPPTPELLPALSTDDFSQLDGMMEAAGVGCGGEDYGAFNAGFEAEVVFLLNQVRADAGLPPLKLSDELTLAARYHAHDMAEDQYFAHDTHDWIDGELAVRCAWHERIRNYFPGPSRLGENIARGYRTPEAVTDAWYDSEGHRSNMLGDYREIGVSFYNFYWVQNFADRADVYPVILNGEASATEESQVDVYAYGQWEQVRFRNDGGEWSDWMSFSNELVWEIPQTAGLHEVEAEMRTGDEVVTSSDLIEYAGPEDPEDEPDRASLQPSIFLPLVTR